MRKSKSTRDMTRTALAVACMMLAAGSGLAAAAVKITGEELALYADRANFSVADAPGSEGRFIVTYAEGTAESGSSLSVQADIARVAALTGAEVKHLRTLATGAQLVQVEGSRTRLTRADDLAREVMIAFARNPAVAYVEPDRLMRATLTPNDTNWSGQWDLWEATAGINAPGAWDIATGTGVRVAVIDTGITPHSDLSGQTVGGYDFISSSTTARDGNGRDANPNDEGDWYGNNECGIGYPASNSSWHGTHVAGTVAAAANNAKGVAGVAFGAKVVPVRVLGKCGGSTSDIVDAMVWASGGAVSGVPANANAAKVLNLSLGGGGSCGSFQAAVNTARNNGAIVVVAAGNDNTNVSSASPANCANVIAVAALNRQGSRASYSNYGAGITLSAPGGQGGTNAGILSTLNTGTTTQGSEAYAWYQGTSMAAPHVAGLGALVFSKNPALTVTQAENYIKNNVRPIPGSCSGGCGLGLIDAQATLQAVANDMGGGSNVPPVANFTYTVNGLTVQFTDNSTDSDGSVVSRSWTFGDGGTSTAANPSRTYAAAGTYNVGLTVTDDDGATHTRTQSVTVSSGGGGSVLQNGVPVTGLSAASGQALTYTLVVPAGATNLSFQISGGSGDADLYVRYGSAPGTTTGTFDCRPYLSGNNETCTISNVQAGTYYVTLRAYTAFSGVTLVGSYTPGSSGNVLQNGVPVSGLGATQGNAVRYTITVPSGVSSLVVTTSGGSGDGDLYVRLGSAPTTSTYTCRSWASGNTETCTIPAPAAGTYHIMVHAYTTFSGLTLRASY
ncbi:Subtilisin [Dokdonella koreensis DS-123]|uniref:Subtilisin n=1 Tax=Dokdonella koreensis DS-123 TaxID=1300342 RepID=A0A167GPV9_9GAMM|nr:Subtilisin [Dokdonella koreensis DS-123]